MRSSSTPSPSWRRPIPGCGSSSSVTAAGLPIIATDVGAVRDMINDGEEGVIVNVGDVDALADQIAILAADADLRTRMGARGRICAERKFRIEDTAAAFQRLLISLARGQAVERAT